MLNLHESGRVLSVICELDSTDMDYAVSNGSQLSRAGQGVTSHREVIAIT